MEKASDADVGFNDFQRVIQFMIPLFYIKRNYKATF